MATHSKYVDLGDPANQFQFVCPVFEVTTRISQCFKLRELVWAGKKQEVRRGCQACMASGKCAAAAIVSKKYPPGKSWQDEYASDEPVVGKVRRDILDRIHRPMVLDSTLRKFGVPDAEAARIASSSERIGKMIGAAPLPDDSQPDRFASAGVGSAVKKRKSSSTTRDTNSAAATGDLAAAINA